MRSSGRWTAWAGWAELSARKMCVGSSLAPAREAIWGVYIIYIHLLFMHRVVSVTEACSSCLLWRLALMFVMEASLLLLIVHYQTLKHIQLSPTSNIKGPYGPRRVRRVH